MKKALLIILLSIFALFIVVLVWLSSMFGSFIEGAMSVRKLDDGLYYMEYSGDDGFDELIAQGGVRNTEELLPYVVSFMTNGFYTSPVSSVDSLDYGCSTLTVRTPEDSVLMGRNFDYMSATGMILHCKPTKGYETITTFNMDLCNFGEDWVPEGFANQYMSLVGLFLALDGINEKGLAIADLVAGDKVETHQNTKNLDFTTTVAIIYLLRNAATVDEALNLLRDIDMHSDIGCAHHYALSDATGRSVVVEYVDNEMFVVETPVVTNHYLCEQKKNVGLIDGDNRYDRLMKRTIESSGVMSLSSLNESIMSVSQGTQGDDFLGTAWTMVMNLTNPSVTYYSRRHFDKPFHFDFKSSR